MSDRMVNCRLHMPNAEGLFDYIADNALPVCRPDSRVGKRVAICGAGPSLRDYAGSDHDEVWAINSALPYLVGRGIRVTHGVTIDHTEAMLGPDEWGAAPDVEYLVASSANPKLVAHLRAQGRTIRFFHNFLGLDNPPGWVTPEGFGGYEEWLYRTKWPTAVVAGAGLNGVPRAIALALGMGFDHIDVYGGDCACLPDAPLCDYYPGTPEYAAWLQTLVMYADGRTPATYHADESIMHAVIDGQRWYTRADMVISAEHMVMLYREYPGRLTYHGNTLVSHLLDKDAAFWADMPKWDNATSSVKHVRRHVLVDLTGSAA